MSSITTIATEVVGGAMTPEERLPVLCEIVRKTESLQVRAIAVLYADKEYERTHGNWTAFCRMEFGWDDSYASRMKKAAEMVLDGVTITNESQARALATVEPKRRNEVLEKARDKFGKEPSGSQVSITADAHDAVEEEYAQTSMKNAQDAIDEVVGMLRDALKAAKALRSDSAGRWINLPHLVTDLKNAAEALKRARPHGPCDEWGKHDANCLCGGTGWLPKHVLERPKAEGPR